MACALGRSGAVLAPFAATMLQSIDVYPQISFGAAAIFAILLSFCATETFGVDLLESEDTKETDAESVKRRRKLSAELVSRRRKMSF